MMSEFMPVLSVTDLDTLDEIEMVDGYRDGFSGEPEPGNNRSRSYWHGWRNGAVDSKRQRIDEAQQQLAREIVYRKRYQ